MPPISQQGFGVWAIGSDERHRLSLANYVATSPAITPFGEGGFNHCFYGLARLYDGRASRICCKEGLAHSIALAEREVRLRDVTMKRARMVLLLTLITGLLEFAIGLAANVASSKLEDDPGQLALVVRHPFVTGLLLILLAAALGTVVWRYLDEGPTQTSADIVLELDRTVEVLAVKLRNQLLEAEALRLVDRPQPLPVRWNNAPSELSDSWSAIRRDAGDCRQIALEGSIAQIGEIYAKIPSGRLVLLGRGGCGKTVLASRFMLSLLPTQGELLAGKPLPVMFSLASWHPDVQHLRLWLESELTSAHPWLGQRTPGGGSLAEELVAHGRILPVLDGLDEMASRTRAAAVKGLSDTLRPGDRLLITSRLPEYSAAVNHAGPLSAAAVVVVEDLEVSDLSSYLAVPSASGTRQNPWASVLVELTNASPESSAAALREVLKTPLMVYMARTIYQTSGMDSRDLLSLGGATSIRAHLFARFISAAYDPGPGGVTWRDHRRVERTERYLRTLATHLVDVGALNLRWWQLSQILTARDRFRLGLMVAVAASGLLMLLVVPFGIETSLLDGPSLGLFLGCLVGITVGRPTVLGRSLSPSPIRIRRWRAPRPLQAQAGGRPATPQSVRIFAWRFGLLVGLTNAAVWALLQMDSNPDTVAMVFVSVAFSVTVPIALATWFAIRLAGTIEEPVELARVVSPPDLLRLDRSTARFEAILCGVSAAVIGAVLSPVIALLVAVVFQPQTLLGGHLHVDAVSLVDLVGTPMVETPAVVVFVLLFLLTAWGRFTLARLYLAVARKLPLHLMTFLADAHRLGILRQAGAVYQFRHIEIRNHLAGAKRGSGAPRATARL